MYYVFSIFIFLYPLFLKNESQGHALRARAAILRCLENGGNATCFRRFVMSEMDPTLIQAGFHCGASRPSGARSKIRFGLRSDSISDITNLLKHVLNKLADYFKEIDTACNER